MNDPEQCQHEERAPLGCYPHQFTTFEHEAGWLCFDCDKMQFYQENWLTPECEALCELERISRRVRFAVELERKYYALYCWLCAHCLPLGRLTGPFLGTNFIKIKTQK